MAHLIVKGIDITFSVNGDTAWHGLANCPRNPDGSFVSNLLKEHVTDILHPIITLPGLASDGPPIEGEIDAGALATIRGLIESGDVMAAFMHARASLFPSRVELPDWKGVAADMRHAGGKVIPLAVHGEDYTEISNSVFWDAKERALQGIPHTVTTAGTLDSARRFYICIELPSLASFKAAGEGFREYLCLVTSHDGTMAAQAFISRMRIVCNNTFTAAEAGATARFRMKHTKNCDASLPGLDKFIRAAHDGQIRFATTYEQLKNTPLSNDRAMSAITGYFYQRTVKDKTGRAGNARLSTRTRNQIDEIFQAFQSGAGNSGESVGDLWNGFTDHYSNGSGVGLTRGGQELDALDKHSNAQWGSANDIKSEVSRLILQPDGTLLQELIAVGEWKGVDAYLEGTGVSRPVYLSGLERTRAKQVPAVAPVIDFSGDAAAPVAPTSDLASLLDMPLSR